MPNDPTTPDPIAAPAPAEGLAEGPAPWSVPPYRPRPLILIGLAGLAGAGKDTIADYLADNHNCLRYALANPIRSALGAMFQLSFEDMHDRERKEQVIPWLGKSPRSLLQTLGTEWGRAQLGDDIWLRVADRLIREIERAPEYFYAPALVLSDIRFENEAAWVRERGGWVVHVRRPGLHPTRDDHVSEAGVALQANDLVIVNAHGLDDLTAAAALMFEEICRLDEERHNAELDDICFR